VAWNFDEVKKRSAEIMATKYKEEIRREALEKLRKLERIIIQSITNHQVSQEIEGGRKDPLNAPNISGTLGGYENLWAFIGFFEGDNPIKDLKDAITGRSVVNSVRVYKNVVRVNAQIPTIEQAYEATPMPWAAGRSWAEGISRGISGFGKYINTDSPHSRSGGGVQSDYKVRPGKFQNTSYLSPIFKQANERFIQVLQESFNITRTT
jgi:hypothetical protein